MFTIQAVQTIWDEIEMARGRNDDEYQGIAFDDPYSVREMVWVSYVCRSGCFMGQQHKYPMAMWDNLGLAFQLLDRLCANAGYPRMIDRCHKPQWHRPDHVRLVFMFAGRDCHPDKERFIEQCLQRVDGVMQQLLAPLESTVS